MTQQTTITVTFTKDELDDLCAALFDSTSFWYNHMCCAREEKDYFLKPEGAALVYDKRNQMYAKFRDTYYNTFPNEED